MHELNKLPQSSAIRREEGLPQRHGTRMTRIGRIFTDIFNPWVSASSAQSVSYRIPPIIYDDKKPQMKAPRVTPLEGAFTYAPAGTYVSMHCGGYDDDKKPQMKTPRVAPLEGAFTYAPAGTYVSMHCGGYDDDKKPQINADERRLISSVHRKGRKERKAAQQESLHFGVVKIRNDINNELERTDTNSGHSEFVRVRISSLLISVLRLLCTLAHGRAPPKPAVHLRSSRAGG